LLVAHFVALLNARNPREPKLRGADSETMQLMKRYPWPGNVRELSNVIENAHVFGTAALIGIADLPATIRNYAPAETGAVTRSVAREGNRGIEDVEREMIKHALEVSRGNKVRAAALLKISRKRLYSRLAKYDLI
jgi:DNA-binding NtrC family response regulator